MTRYLWMSAIASVALLVFVLYLIRTRKLHERFALIWLMGAVVIGVLTAWPMALEAVARVLGIASPPNALFIVLGAFFIWVLLHGSVALTKLARQNLMLAQRIALLEARLRDAEDPHTSTVASRSAERPPEPATQPHE